MSRKLAQEYLKKGDKINTKVIFDNGRIFKIEIEGEHKSMSDQPALKSLEKQIQDLAKIVETGFKNVNSRLDNIETRLDKVETRLDKVESRLEKVETRLDNIESLPTIKKELKSKNKK